MDGRVILLFLFSGLRYSYGLTSNEIAAFNNGVVVDESINGTYYKITATGLPAHSTPKVNPNDPSEQSHEIWVKKNPEFTKSTCLPLGMIGVAFNGVSLFNPLTDEGYDAVTGENKEIFDSCNGHPTVIGEYHYHQIPNCLYNNTVDQFLGVALDGYPIYGPNVSDYGREIKRSELDMCCGRNSTINGVTAYRYYITREFPYILGCFRGDIIRRSDMMGYNTSYPCSPSATACNCPLNPRRGPPPGAAASSMANLLMVSVFGAWAAYISLE